MAAEVAQIRPPQSEELAQNLEKLAAQARSGELLGYSALLIKSGGTWSDAGFNPHGLSAFELIGRHVYAIIGIYLSTLGTDDGS